MLEWVQIGPNAFAAHITPFFTIKIRLVPAGHWFIEGQVHIQAGRDRSDRAVGVIWSTTAGSEEAAKRAAEEDYRRVFKDALAALEPADG